jgi:hypothetical protein
MPIKLKKTTVEGLTPIVSLNSNKPGIKTIARVVCDAIYKWLITVTSKIIKTMSHSGAPINCDVSSKRKSNTSY